MDPVNAQIGESDEKRELQNAVVWERLVRKRIIEFSVTADLSDQERRGQEGHDGH